MSGEVVTSSTSVAASHRAHSRVWRYFECQHTEAEQSTTEAPLSDRVCPCCLSCVACDDDTAVATASPY